MEHVVCLPESSSVVTSTKFLSPVLALGPRQADVNCNLCSTSSSVSIGFQEYSVLPFMRVHPKKKKKYPYHIIALSVCMCNVKSVIFP